MKNRIAVKPADSFVKWLGFFSRCKPAEGNVVSAVYFKHV